MRTVARVLAGCVVAGSALVGWACSAEDVAVPDDPALASGQQVYQARCASCHGLTGNGGLGPPIAGIVTERYPDVADNIAVVANGIPGTSMRAFDTILSPEEITAVVRYTRESL
jgi:cytochrome c oxidase subunit 2